MTKGQRAGETPIGVDVVEGKSYYWCTCGKSLKQPFCDGSHKGTTFKPFIFKDEWLDALNNSKYGGLVLDDDYVDGVAKNIACEMMLRSNKKVYSLGLEDRTAGFDPKVDNLPPNPDKIVETVLQIINSKK